jgi:hypothetical protein
VVSQRAVVKVQIPERIQLKSLGARNVGKREDKKVSSEVGGTEFF